jgi:hypothetical protein
MRAVVSHRPGVSICIAGLLSFGLVAALAGAGCTSLEEKLSSSSTSSSSTGAGGTGGNGGSGGTGGNGGSAGGGGGAGGGSCQIGAEIDAVKLKTESVARLRSFFGKAAGFDDGDLWYRDGASALDDCPLYDQSQILYAAPAPDDLIPKVLGAGPWAATVVWGLNGVPYIGLRSAKKDETFLANDYSAVSACASLKPTLSPAEQKAFADALQIKHPAPPGGSYTFLDAIGVLCWSFADENADSGLVGTETAAAALGLLVADELPSAPEVQDVTIGSFVYKYPFNFAAPTKLDATAPFRPECLRTFSATLKQGDFASLPSFPKPFGAGWQANANACQ